MNAPAPKDERVTLSAEEFDALAAIVHEVSGIVVSAGKSSMVHSRLWKRLRALGKSDYSSYIAHLRSPEGVEERRHLVSALTTNVTGFFRENHHFETLRDQVLPPLLARARAGGRVRLWSAGCSTGAEAYSMAITIAQTAPDFANYDIRILATDIDPLMVAHGKAARFDLNAVAGLSEDLRTQFLIPAGNDFQIIPALRSLVQFRELNLHDAWPMSGGFDVIFCRNVVIYFTPEARMRLWTRFESKLAPGGWMFMGHSERIPDLTQTRLDPAGITAYRLRAEDAATKATQCL